MKLALKLPDGSQINPAGGMPSYSAGSLNLLVQNLVTMLLVLSSLIALAFLIWGGISWITSGGDKNGLDAARKKITYAIIGMIVILSSFLIVTTVGNLFGIELFKLPGS